MVEQSAYIFNLPQCTFNEEHELQFPADDSFCTTVRGLLEAKSSNNAFFTFDKA